MTLGQADIRKAVDRSDLPGRVVCLHSSLKSFGTVDGGADAVIDAFLEAGCTLIVPTFTYFCQIPPPAGWSAAPNLKDRNWIYLPEEVEAFDPDANRIVRGMGAIPARVLERPGRIRGFHPKDSFTGLGPQAAELIAAQAPLNIYGPFKQIYAGLPAFLVFAGVGLTAATAVHFAEELSGRPLFRSWTRVAGRADCEVEEGGCSDGFENLAPAVRSLERRMTVGDSLWRIYPFKEFIDTLVPVLRENPSITHCGKPDCCRCNDAVKSNRRI